ncbi:MAG: ABC transporter substrate-binding protein [Gammaproteobacteria bacterium]|nr:ABC transporter substrate-binding protein [Gammaproteobacteria bacterium]
MKRTRPVTAPASLYRLLPALLLFALALLSGCGDHRPITIGFIAGTSGRVADLGISGLDAVQLAIAERNDRGGIDGRPLRLITVDDQQNPQRAKSVAQQLVDQGIEIVIGPMTSDMGMAVAPILDRAGVVNVSPTVTTQRLSALDDHFFRVSATTSAYAGRSATFQLRPGGMRRIVAIIDANNRSFTQNWLDNFSTPFTAGGGEVVATVAFDTSQARPLAAVVGEALGRSIDGVLIIANSMDAALLCQQIRKTDPNVPVTLADWGATERLLELGGKAVEGVTVVQTFDRDNPGPKYQKFRQAYIERYQREPGFPGVYAYDAAQVVLTALAQRKRGETLKQTILRIRVFKGLQGDFSFDDHGDVEREQASISIVRDRKFIVID